jgi:hypothetical protein
MYQNSQAVASRVNSHSLLDTAVVSGREKSGTGSGLERFARNMSL